MRGADKVLLVRKVTVQWQSKIRRQQRNTPSKFITFLIHGKTCLKKPSIYRQHLSCPENID
jgi:hypothetical protein